MVLDDEEGDLDARMAAMVSLLQFEFVTRESSFDLACRFGVARREGGEDADELLEQAILALKDRKSTRLNSSHLKLSRMPSSA